jgi:hypothetical protein
MIVIYCADSSYIGRLMPSVDLGETVIVFTTAKPFERALSTANGCVIVARGTEDRELLARLPRLRNAVPTVPLVVVTTSRAALPEHIAMVADRVIWLGDVVTALPPALRGAVGRRFTRRFLIAIQSATIPPYLRAALELACKSEGAIRSVSELASRVPCHRRTLDYQWRQVTHGHGSLRLEDFLGWLTLIAAFDRRTRRSAWSLVASDLHVHEHTLARHAKRLVGRSLSQLHSDAGALFRTTVMVDVLRCLIDERDAAFWADYSRLAVEPIVVVPNNRMEKVWRIPHTREMESGR